MQPRQSAGETVDKSVEGGVDGFGAEPAKVSAGCIRGEQVGDIHGKFESGSSFRSLMPSTVRSPVGFAHRKRKRSLRRASGVVPSRTVRRAYAGSTKSDSTCRCSPLTLQQSRGLDL